MLEPLFIRLQALGQKLYQNETPAQMFFYGFFKVFKSTCFTKHLRMTASEYAIVCSKDLP